jgi:hypothetical protein
MLVCVSLHYLARETAGAARIRLSLRPLIGEDAKETANPGRKRAAGMRRRVWGDVIARSEATKQSILLFAVAWIASRSLSSGAHSRDPLARNDGLEQRATLSTVIVREGGRSTPALTLQKSSTFHLDHAPAMR